MPDRIPTLVFYAAGFPNARRTIYDTVREELGFVIDKVPLAWRNTIFTHRFFNGYQNLSYVLDWKDAFLQTPFLQVDACNINNVLHFRKAIKKLGSYNLIVILHSAAGDSMDGLLSVVPQFKDRKGKLLVFYGNEYTLMAEKISFAQQVQADFIGSQLPLETAKWLYADCHRSVVLPAPPALNVEVYRSHHTNRPVDIGFRGTLYPQFIGDIERTSILTELQNFRSGRQLTIDVKFGSVTRHRWVEFLNRCKGIPGAEAGTYYLRKDDNLQRAVCSYIKKNKPARFEDIYARFFKDETVKSGKSISSRHFEAIGTKTCQLLLEGEYNGLLQPHIHYIPVKKDLSNLEDGIQMLLDNSYRSRIADCAYEYALSAHTYRHRVDQILKAVVS